MRLITLALTLTLVLLAGCMTTASRMDKLHLGMTREEVIKIMGNPTSSDTLRSVETLNYRIYESINDWLPVPYYVRLVDGRVEAFGRRGDVETTPVQKRR